MRTMLYVQCEHYLTKKCSHVFVSFHRKQDWKKEYKSCMEKSMMYLKNINNCKVSLRYKVITVCI